ncbi:MAG: hypothetical protein RR720_05360 [Comamonas sp.]|uniref:hypothetical protein n=1 Tax=Comamonas sp. TaxID=34028 RepID=UPI002FC88C64
MSDTDSAAAASCELRELNDKETQDCPFGSFIALKRLSKLNIEAVRMQGCADSGTFGNN